MEKKADLREVKRKTFVTEQNGDIKLVSSVEINETYLEDNSIRDDSRSKVQWRCDLCGEFVDSFTVLEGDKLGFQCGCVKMRVKKILSDQFWNPGSHVAKDVERARELKKCLKKTNRMQALN